MLTRMKRKDQDIGPVFGTGFSWGEVIDAAADVYNGVCSDIYALEIIFDS